MKTTPLQTAILTLLLILASPILSAEEITKVLLHVSSSSKTTHRVAIENVINLQNKFGIKNVIIEIVANGTGVGIANARNSINTRIQSLISSGVRLSVCSASLNQLRKNGSIIDLVNGSVQISNGIVRVIELQKEGYIYVHP